VRETQVVTVTPCVKGTTEYKGTRVISVLGLQLPFYNSKTLLLGTGTYAHPPLASEKAGAPTTDLREKLARRPR